MRSRTATANRCTRRHVALVRALLLGATFIDARNAIGNTPLHVICRVMLKLLECEADVDTEDDEGRTAYQIAL